MRFLAGMLTGAAAVWAAAAIWRTLPGLTEDPWPPEAMVDEDAFEHVGTGRPGYTDSVAGWPPPPRHDPQAHITVV